MTNDNPLNGLTAPLNDSTVLNYCNKLLTDYASNNSANQFKIEYDAVREKFPERLTIETSDNIVIIENDYYSPLYVTSLIDPFIRFAIDCSIQSKTNNEKFRVRLYSDIHKDYAQGTPCPFGLNEHKALKRLSNEQFNNLVDAITQTVKGFVQAVQTTQF